MFVNSLFLLRTLASYSQEHLYTKLLSNNYYVCIYGCRCSDEVKPRARPLTFSNQKLKDMGIHFVPVKQCLYETVMSLQEKGLLPIFNQQKLDDTPSHPFDS